MSTDLYRASSTAPQCPHCSRRVAAAEQRCGDCTALLEAERWKGMRVGLRLSPLLATGIVPALAARGGATALWATGAWVLGPFVWVLFFRRKPGARSRERAVGIALVHMVCVLTVLTGAAMLGVAFPAM